MSRNVIMHACMHVCTCVCVCVSVCVCMHACICMYIVYVCMYVYYDISMCVDVHRESLHRMTWNVVASVTASS